MSPRLFTIAVMFPVLAWTQPDSALWDSLVRKYVTPASRVDYSRWKRDGAGKLDSYLAEVAKPWPRSVGAGGSKAALINAYNALMIRWVLANYPVASVWRTGHPFDARRHEVDGDRVSLDDIETRLRSMGDPRIHAALVCASRSCPPLRREAYTGNRIDEQLDDNVRAWLADGRLNEFMSERHTARVSKIFDWYGKDFERGGESVRRFLARFAPDRERAFLREEGVRIEFIPYHWGLNDTSDLGAGYTTLQFLADRARNAF